MSARQPSLFVSHGSPMLAVEDGPARRFLAEYGRSLPRPEAVAVVSAHWETEAPAVGGSAAPTTIHDFGGFPQALYRLRYPAPGAPDWAARAARALGAGGEPAVIASDRGLDHGAWVPLMLLFPEADVPVFQVSVQPRLGPAHMERIGRLLAPLRDRGLMVVGSGSLTHNLGRLDWSGGNGSDPAARDFADWIAAATERNDRRALLNYRKEAPGAILHHPTEEHLLPLFAAMGAGDPSRPGQRIHASATYGSLMMDAFAFP